MDYIKLSQLVGQTFTVEKVWGYKWKAWDQQNKKMLVSDKYEKGYSKEYELDTDKGKLGLSKGQLGQLLEAVFQNGVADLNGKTFSVKSNGKTGMDIRYYFNSVTPVQYKDDEMAKDAQREDIDISGIPF